MAWQHRDLSFPGHVRRPLPPYLIHRRLRKSDDLNRSESSAGSLSRSQGKVGHHDMAWQWFEVSLCPHMVPTVGYSRSWEVVGLGLANRWSSLLSDRTYQVR